MATALNWLARDRIFDVASLRIILQKYTILELDSNIVRFFQKKIGMHATLLSQYIQGTKIPSTKQLAKIQEGIHSLGKELQEVNLI